MTTEVYDVNLTRQVLDRGEVQLVDAMASDAKVYGSARIIHSIRPEEASKGPDKDRSLIDFLMRNGHGTPFEHAVFQWYVKAPIFVIREWQRHRMASYNEQSGRYSEFEPEFYVPDHARIQSPTNRQAALATDDPALDRTTQTFIRSASIAAYTAYRELLEQGVAREMARMLLPVNLYTRIWFTVNARSLMNFLALRNHPTAQWEIQQYAAELEADFARLMPITYEVFVAYGRIAP